MNQMSRAYRMAAKRIEINRNHLACVAIIDANPAAGVPRYRYEPGQITTMLELFDEYFKPKGIDQSRWFGTTRRWRNQLRRELALDLMSHIVKDL